jgi:hypothetical protein
MSAATALREGLAARCSTVEVETAASDRNVIKILVAGCRSAALSFVIRVLPRSSGT